MESIDLYLKEDIFNDLFLNEHYLLQEGLDIKIFRTNIQKFKDFLTNLSKIKNKRDAIRYIQRNDKKLKNITKIFLNKFINLQHFDPFGDNNVNIPPPPTSSTTETVKKTKTPKSPPAIPQVKKEPVQKQEPKKEENNNADVEITKYSEKKDTEIYTPEQKMKRDLAKVYKIFKNFIIKLFEKIKRIFKMDDVDTPQVADMYDKIYFFLIKGIQITVLIGLYKMYGPIVIGVVSIIAIFMAFINLIYIKMNNQSMSYGEAFRESFKEIKDMLQKMITGFKIYKEEYILTLLGIVILYLSDMALKILISFSVASFSSMFFVVIFTFLVIYYVMLMFDRVSTDKYKKGT